ncbi:hypothetical protein BDV35DRAFT_114456 [Aspergillus flavus]|uniref:Uncharacterized protein n=1 Tax=Aspergillus flavus TaxID=5059 RepID=A0A5N6H6L4_ASPFL|nr:hypothetical protein BDV35DRAFT_114456 [Aspergillus flavus]
MVIYVISFFLSSFSCRIFFSLSLSSNIRPSLVSGQPVYSKSRCGNLTESYKIHMAVNKDWNRRENAPDKMTML